MLQEARTMKDKQFRYMADLITQTKNGKLSIKIKPRKSHPKVLIKSSDSKSIDHSILFPICQ